MKSGKSGSFLLQTTPALQVHFWRGFGEQMAVDFGGADSIAAVEEVFWHAEARLRLKGGWWSYGRNRLFASD